MHVLPRKKGDFKRDDEIYDRLNAHDKENSQFSIAARTDAEMEAESTELRRLFYDE